MSASPEPEDVKPKMNLTIVFGDKSIRLMVKKSTPFAKVFEAACNKFNQPPAAVRFHFEGTRLQAQDTPLTHGMEDGDQIDAAVEQIGGACCRRS